MKGLKEPKNKLILLKSEISFIKIILKEYEPLNKLEEKEKQGILNYLEGLK